MALGDGGKLRVAGSSGDADKLEMLGMGFDHPQRAFADGAGGAEEDYPPRIAERFFAHKRLKIT